MKLLLLFLFLRSQPILALDIPSLTGPVVDAAGLLRRQEKDSLSRQLYQYQSKTGHQFQVLIVESLEGEAIEAYSIRVAEKWKIGNEKRDDGVLLLIASKDRAWRIEVGQGLEGALPDVVAARIGRGILVPAFREGRFAEGISQTFNTLAAQLNSDLSLEVPARAHRSQWSDWIVIILVIVFSIFMFFVRLLSAPFRHLGGRGRMGGWSGGGSSWGGGFGGGGGSWSGGGGGFSGGGASGRW